MYFIYSKYRVMEGRKERKLDLPSADSLSEWLEWPGWSQAEARN